MLRPGGALVITVPGIEFPRHDYPSDYWRFTDDGIRVLMEGMDRVTVTQDHTNVFGVGFNPERIIL